MACLETAIPLMIATFIVDGDEEATLSLVLEVSSDSPVFSRILMSALFSGQWND